MCTPMRTMANALEASFLLIVRSLCIHVSLRNDHVFLFRVHSSVPIASTSSVQMVTHDRSMLQTPSAAKVQEPKAVCACYSSCQGPCLKASHYSSPTRRLPLPMRASPATPISFSSTTFKLHGHLNSFFTTCIAAAANRSSVIQAFGAQRCGPHTTRSGLNVELQAHRA